MYGAGPIGALEPLVVLLLVAAVAVVAVAASGGRAGGGRQGSGGALDILDRRLVAGDIDPADYERRRALLAGAGRRPADSRRAALVVGTALLVFLLVLSMAIFFGGRWAPQPVLPRGSASYSSPSCSAPANLPGRVVGVTLFDMSGRPQAGGPGNPVPPAPPGMATLGQMMGPMMGIAPAVTSVPAGQVTLVATNGGWMIHELLVLPLTGSARAGSRQVGTDGTVDETGRLGEVSNSCAAGSGGGLRPGTAGWTTPTLPAGRYELLCNLPGHYAAGMYAELTVS